MHDSGLDHTSFYRPLYGACGAHPVDRAHMETVATLGRLAGVAHAEGGAEDGRLDVVHGHRIPRQDRLHISVSDEPFEVGSGTGVHQRRPYNPHQVPSAALLFPYPGGELLVVHRSFATDLG